MTEEHNLTRVFSGSMIEVDYIREKLEEIGIPSIVKEHFSAGILTSPLDTTDLYVDDEDKNRAKEFIENIEE